MAIKNNHFYNDPAMAQAAANLSDLFGAPSGSDASGYATARATDLETGQRQAIWDYMQDPNADQTLLDRAGVFSDLYDPTQSYAAVQSTADTARYGYDTQALTSRSNNNADNIQLAAANAATNAQSGANNAADNRRQALIAMHENLSPGEIRPGWTPEEAKLLGVPEMAQVSGAVKPLSLEEQKADYLRRMATGDTTGLTDTDIIKQALLGTEQQATVDPVTHQPVLTNRFEAAGAQPVLSETDEKGLAFSQLPDRSKQESVVDIKGVDTYHAVDPKGAERSFVGYIGSDGKIYDQADPSKPAEGVVSKGSGGNQFAVDFNPDGTVAGIRQGAGAGTGRPPTEAQMRSGYAAESAEPSIKRLLTAYDDPNLLPSTTDMAIWPSLNQMSRSESIPTATIGRFINDQALTGPGKTFFLDLMNMLPLELMQRSGLAQTQTEWANELYNVVPQPNDTKEMRQIRKEHLTTFLRATKRMAGPAAAPEAATAAPAATAPAAAAPAATAPAAPAAPAAGDFQEGDIVSKPGFPDQQLKNGVWVEIK